MNNKELLSKILITNINQYLVTDNDAENLCLKANLYGLAGAIVGPSSLEKLRKYKGNTKIGVSTSYPSGAYPADAKTEEIRIIEDEQPIADSYFATIFVGNYLSGNKEETRKEISEIAKCTNKPVYLILEAGVLADAQLAEICGFAKDAGIKGIVSTTCFAPYELPQTTPEQVQRLRKAADQMQVVAFVNTTSKEEFEALIDAGTDYLMVSDIAELI